MWEKLAGEKEEGRRGRKRRRSKTRRGKRGLWVKVKKEARKKARKDFNLKLYLGQKEQFKFKF